MIVMYSETKGVMIMTNKTDVIYKDIPNYEGVYQVSNTGIVRRLRHWVANKGLKNATGYFVPEVMLKPQTDSHGYYRVSLSKGGVVKNFNIHTLVLLAFAGERPTGMEIRHLNSNKLDNRLENLAYGTKSENMQDAVKCGTLVFSRSKLTQEEVMAIAKDTRNNREIAKAFGCHVGTVQAIKTGKSFKGFTGHIEYTPRNKKKLDEETLSFIRDRNNSRQLVINITGLTINQIKRIRQGQNYIYTTD